MVILPRSLVMNNSDDPPYSSSPEIIFIDDDPFMEKVFEKCFRPYDLSFEFYSCSKEGLAQILKKRPKLVILDYWMPDMTGREIIVTLSEHHIFKTTSIALCTSHELSGMERIEFMTLGFEKVLSKPVKKSDVHELIQEYFPHKTLSKSA